MPTKPENCVNHETNEQQCPCANVSCENHGVCCECIQSHAAKGNRNACMRGAERPAATMALPIGKNRNCTSIARNNKFCPCGEVSCNRHGLCCDCVRFHWGHEVWPIIGCMG